MEKNEITIAAGRSYQAKFEKDGFIMLNGTVLTEDLLTKINYFQSGGTLHPKLSDMDNSTVMKTMADLSRIYSFLIFANGEIWGNEKLSDEVFGYMKELSDINDFIAVAAIPSEVKERIGKEIFQ